MSRRFALAALLFSVAVPALAQSAAPPPAPASTALEPARDDVRVDRWCLRDTGTHIRTRAKADAHRRCASVAAGRVFTQDDLRATGEIDIADALRRLDPSIR